MKIITEFNKFLEIDTAIAHTIKNINKSHSIMRKIFIYLRLLSRGRRPSLPVNARLSQSESEMKTNLSQVGRFFIPVPDIVWAYSQ